MEQDSKGKQFNPCAEAAWPSSSCSRFAWGTERPVEIENTSNDGSEAQQLQLPNARRMVTKIDLRILPILSLSYLVAFLDRVNIGNAVVFGVFTLTATLCSMRLTIVYDRSQQGAQTRGDAVQCGVDNILHTVHPI
jgi:hypothetical protein